MFHQDENEETIDQLQKTWDKQHKVFKRVMLEANDQIESCSKVIKKKRFIVHE